MFNEIAGDEHLHVERGALAFREPVITIGIDEVVEAFSQFDESVDQPFGNLYVRVGFAGAGDDQQVAAQALGVVDRRASAVTFGILLWCAHENFLILGVVILRLRLRHHGDADMVGVWLAEQRVERVRAAAAPAPDAHSREVHEWTEPRQCLQTGGLLVGRERPETAIHRSSPRRALGPRSAPVIN